MNIAFGHTYMDLDCLGSLVLIKKLFPDYRLVRSSLIHPVAKKVYNLYHQYFDFLHPEDLDGTTIERIIIVDTCLSSRVKEYFSHIRDSDPEIRIIDHHDPEKCDIMGVTEVEGTMCGANVSNLGKMLIAQGLTLEPEEATIALTAIYADTGRFTFENVKREDFDVSAYLLDQGASIKLAKSFLDTVIEDDQILTLNHLLSLLTVPRVAVPHILEAPDIRWEIRSEGFEETGSLAEVLTIQGHSILFTYMTLDGNVSGLAGVVEKIMDVENPEAYFAFFFIPKKKTVLLIARSQKHRIDLHELLFPYGGGGHQSAASATISNEDGRVFYIRFLEYLERALKPAIRARDFMTDDVRTIEEHATLMEASKLLETIDMTALPVLNEQGMLSGFISLRDISRGRKNGRMQSPVKSFMVKNVITAPGSITLREVERTFYRHHIGHLPIVEDGRLLGIVSRWDYLEEKKRQGQG
jgi:tRNA nucleotidyltransferase (CCA-adding enzyme)